MILFFFGEFGIQMKKKYYFIIAFIFIAFIAFILYYPVLKAGYVWDDNLLFVSKVKLVNEPLSWAILTEPVLPDTTYFRPLVFLTIYLEFHLFGQLPFSSHLFNLLILIFNAYLVSFIAYKLLKLKGQSNAILWGSIAGIIYVVNPVLVEATAWISGRFDLLVTTFTLLAIYLFITIKNTMWLNSIILSLCFLMALFSKELGIILPILLFFVYMYLHVEKDKTYFQNVNEFIRDYYRLIVCIGLTTLIYFGLRIQAMGEVYHQGINGEYIKAAYFENYLPIHSLFFYIKQFIVPFNELTPLLPFDDLNDYIYSTYLKGIILLAGVFAIIWGIIKKNKYVWIVLSILLTISLVIYIIPITIANNVAHNRFMTLGAAFMAILVVLISSEKIKTSFRWGVMGLMTIWVMAAAVVTKSVVPFWHSDFTLWKWTYTVQPNNDLARNSYLFGLYQARKFNEIITEVDNYLAKNPSGLSIGDQIIYVNTLISTNNKETILYAKGVEVALPKFHEIYEKKEDFHFDHINDGHIASFYGAYALATAVFEHNFEKAVKLNEIAYWYLNDDEKVTYFFNDVAYLYLSGKTTEAVNLYQYLKRVNAYGKERYYYNMLNIVDTECKNRQAAATIDCAAQREKFMVFIGEKG